MTAPTDNTITTESTAETAQEMAERYRREAHEALARQQERDRGKPAEQRAAESRWRDMQEYSEMLSEAVGKIARGALFTGRVEAPAEEDWRKLQAMRLLSEAADTVATIAKALVMDATPEYEQRLLELAAKDVDSA